MQYLIGRDLSCHFNLENSSRLGLLNAQVDVINPSSELRDSFAKLKINYTRKLVFTKTAPHTPAPIQNFQHLQFLIASYNFPK